MLESESIVNRGNEIVAKFQGRRLFQVVMATEITLFLVILLYLYLNDWYLVIVLSVIMALISSVFLFIKLDKISIGATILLTISALSIVYLMWLAMGVRDDALLMFPGIFVFAVILGNNKLALVLLAFVIANVLAIGYVNSAGIYINEVAESSFSVAIIVSILLLLVSYSVWLLSSDLRQLLKIVTEENNRVLQSKAKIEELFENEKKLRAAELNIHKLQKLENIGILAGGIAHDFNNILTSIFGNISLAKMKLENDHPSIENLNKSEQSIERATLLTHQLITFAKGGEPLKEDIDLSTIIRDTILFDLAGSNIKPVFDFSEESLFASVDKGQIQQIISNLAINAIQAMPEGGVVYISAANIKIIDHQVETLAGGDYIKVDIRDEGIGIDDFALDKIFDPYFTTKKDGNGLGLAIVYSIIKKHGGVVNVQSELGKGTGVTFYLPASESQVLQNITNAVDQADVDHNNKILVMDDDIAILAMVSAILEQKGFIVTTVVDGDEMLEAYKKAMDNSAPFDAVIMDLTIPGAMGGKEAMEELLKINMNAKCIVSSGYADDPIMANYADYGFLAAISKPFLLEDLYSLLVRVISK